MRGATLPLAQYAFMAWCSRKAQGQLYVYICLYRYSFENSSYSTDVYVELPSFLWKLPSKMDVIKEFIKVIT
jgi:hypothetical protein